MKKRKNADPAHDVLGYERRALDAIFDPDTVAVVGASDRPGSVGRTIMWNLISNPFGGTVYPVNARRQNVLGIKAYPSVSEIPERVDLAVIASPAPTVPEIIRECVECGVRGAIIISAGFRETGPEGAELERQVLEEARRGRMRIIGPNCLGVMNPTTGLNATFAGAMARPGNVGFLSQSGALMTAILDRSFVENVGFSAFVSVGSMMDVGWGDLIYYLGDDRHTESIVIYMESVGDARSFLSAAREVALTKPIIVIKAGRTAAASHAAASHTGSLTGSDGILVVLTPQDMTDPMETAQDLTPLAQSTRKPVLASWMGGAGVAPANSVLNGAGVPTFDYPDSAARSFASMWRYTYNLRSIYETPELATDGEDIDRERAEKIVTEVRAAGRTILTEFESKSLLAAYGIPAVETKIARGAQEAVELAEDLGYPVVLKLDSNTITHKTDVGGVRLNLENAQEVRRAYEEMESSISENYSPEDFAGATVQPMVSLEGYELIMGSSLDAQFGPVLLFGSGGQLVEVYRDRALALPPLTTTLARRTMEQTHIFDALKGVRGRPPVDTAALEKLFVRFGQLVVEQPWIRELDINPLLASPERLISLDARVVLHDPETGVLPRTAIRPYPTQYIWAVKTRDGEPVTIRPIRPEDEPLMVEFHESLSEQSVYMRYFHMLGLDQRTAHERLTRICFIDYDREMALVAERTDPETGEKEIMGVARLSRRGGVTDEAEFSVLISDRFQ